MRKLYWLPLVCAAGCGPSAADEDTTFTLRLRADRDVIEQIAAAAPESVRQKCEDAGGAVRVFNPLREGEYADVPCSALGEAEPVPDGEPAAEPQWSPAGVACGAIMGGLGLLTHYHLCGHTTTPPAEHPDRWPAEDRPGRDVENCRRVGDGGFFTAAILCTFLF